MLTTRGGFSFAPGFTASVESGRVRCSAGCVLKVVVTSRKITSTISTSISATMMTAGVVRRLWMWKRMVRADELLLVPVLPADELIAQSFHLDRKHLDLLGEISPGDERGDGDEQADQGRP